MTTEQTLISDNKSYTITLFNDETKAQHLGGCVHMNKFHTETLKAAIKIENWGKQNKRLYHYLDHTFRYNFNNNNIKLYESIYYKIAIFGTKLYKKNDERSINNQLYIIMLPSTHSNQKTRGLKKWFLSKDMENNPFFLTKMEISYKYGIKLDDIPTHNIKSVPYSYKYPLSLQGFYRTFSSMLKKGSTYWAVIINEFKLQNNITFKNKSSVAALQELLQPFNAAIKYSFSHSYSKNTNNNNNNIKSDDNDGNNENKNFIIPGAFWIKNESKYKIMYHMLINVRYMNKNTKFVVVLDKHTVTNTYICTKILTLHMGLCNTRLIDELNGVWSPWYDKLDIILKDIGINTYPRYCEIKRIRTLTYNHQLRKVFDSVEEIAINNNSCGHNHINFSKELSFVNIYSIDKCDKGIINDLLKDNILKIESSLEINHLSLKEMIVNEKCLIFSKPLRMNIISYYTKPGILPYFIVK